MTDEVLLEVNDLSVVFPLPKGDVQAVCGVSFRVREQEIFGIVGESGCGKTCTGRSILRLVPSPGVIAGGEILFRGENLLEKTKREMRRVRGGDITMVFQDPAAALNPLFRVGQQLFMIMEEHHVGGNKRARRELAIELLEDLGLPDANELLESYPHELSGGMKQRAMIGMALCTGPGLIIADEPTSALDVTIQSQILDILRQLKEEAGVSIILITHDLGVVAETCDRLAVFYRGRIVEQGGVHEIYNEPRHPYTLGLLEAIPNPAVRQKKLRAIPGTVPTNAGLVQGCGFASRCGHATDVCRERVPPLMPSGRNHLVACHRFDDGGG